MDLHAHRLVVQALTCTLSNCVEWVNEKTANRVRSDSANQGLRPWEIIRLLREFVRSNDPSCVEQIREEREGWRHQRDYWYKVIVPVDGFPQGLFVELELLDDDPDVPVVVLLNAHPKRREAFCHETFSLEMRHLPEPWSSASRPRLPDGHRA